MNEPQVMYAGIEVIVLGALFVGAAAVAYDGYQKAKKAARAAADAARGLLYQTRATALPRRIAYGTARMGGIEAYVTTTGDDNEYLHYILIWSDGPNNNVFQILFDGEIAWQTTAQGDYAGLLEHEFAYGHFPQDALTGPVAAISDWTDSDRLYGICYSWLQLEYDQSVFENGVPDISAVVVGNQEVFDPRDGDPGVSSNPVLCCAHYLSRTKIGPGIHYWREQEIESLIAAANACDESVTLTVGGTENRYEFNGVISLDNTAEDIIVQFRTAMAGSIVYVSGKWHYYAGVYITPTFEITESMIRGKVTQKTKQTKRDRINTVRGLFSSPDNNYFPTDFPAYQDSTFVEEDGEELTEDIELINTKSKSMSRRIAKIQMMRSRYSRQVSVPLNIEGLRVHPGLTCGFSYSRLGYANTPMDILTWRFSVEDKVLKVEVDLRETNSLVYGWDAADDATDETDPVTATAVGAPAAGVGGDSSAVIGGLGYGDI